VQVSEAAGKEQNFSPFDLSCMKRAFALAKRGQGKTSPNPMVGAVLVKDRRIIGEGWHRRHGQAHAEVEAVQAALTAGYSLAGAELYCTLEPCCFTASDKLTPPCTDLIVKNGIKKIYIANLDPNKKVSGKGVAMLEKSGIEVVTGLNSELGEELNRAFFTFHRLGRPYVHLKLAQTLDGKIAALDGSSRWISCEASRRMVHSLRACYDAVLVGGGTALADDPELTVRLVKGRNPARVVLDSSLSIKETAKLFSRPQPEPAGESQKNRCVPLGKTIIIHSDDASPKKAEQLKALGALLIPLPVNTGQKAKANIGIPVAAALQALAEQRVQSVLVEGGARVFNSFLREGLWDRLTIVIAPLILGSGMNSVSDLGLNSMSQAIRFESGTFRRLGAQTVFEVNREEGVCSQE
jgi:diaminohydroxyphosphoribosylaminopyrimidine deaminase/5-amino-6-(5-phosphoribosylamino)uracil reductase